VKNRNTGGRTKKKKNPNHERAKKKLSRGGVEKREMGKRTWEVAISKSTVALKGPIEPEREGVGRRLKVRGGNEKTVRAGKWEGVTRGTPVSRATVPGF